MVARIAQDFLQDGKHNRVVDEVAVGLAPQPSAGIGVPVPVRRLVLLVRLPELLTVHIRVIHGVELVQFVGGEAIRDDEILATAAA